MGEVSTIGLDIAKSIFQIHGVDVDGAVVIRKRVRRAKVSEFFSALPPCFVGIEACPSAHHWSRQLQVLGHAVKLMPPSYVKAYLKRSKNDANDAAAICEAVTRPSMRFVPTKSEQQQSGLMLHRSRQLLVRQRTMLSNAIRGHMAELGIISAKGRNGTTELLEVIAKVEDDRIPPAARFSLGVLARQYANVTAEIGAIEKPIHAWHRSCEESRRLEEIPGVGPIVATALVAEVGDWKAFGAGTSLARATRTTCRAAFAGLISGSSPEPSRRDRKRVEMLFAHLKRIFVALLLASFNYRALLDLRWFFRSGSASKIYITSCAYTRGPRCLRLADFVAEVLR